MSEKDILGEFCDVISVDDNSLGTLPGTVHFTTDVTVDPKVVSPKRVPVGLKEKLKLWGKQERPFDSVGPSCCCRRCDIHKALMASVVSTI